MDQIVTELGNSELLPALAGFMLLLVSAALPLGRGTRILGAFGGVLAVIGFSMSGTSALGMLWGMGLAVANGLHLLKQDKPDDVEQLDLSGEEKLFSETVLPGVDPKIAQNLLGIGHWRVALPGAELMEEGQRMPELIFIARGAAVVEIRGKLVGVCGPGDFLGEISFLSGQPASATVRVANSVHYCAFERDALQHYLDAHPTIRSELEAGFNRNLTAKLMRTNAVAAGNDSLRI
jgi:CRP-like cAMP-binding protein